MGAGAGISRSRRPSLVLSAIPLGGAMSTNYPPTNPRMAVLRFTIVPDEFLGLNALIEPDGADDGGDTRSAVVGKARALMRGALADKLQEIGLPWAPSAEAVKKRAAEAAEPTSGMRALMGNKKVRKYGTSVVAVAALVVLWGGTSSDGTGRASRGTIAVGVAPAPAGTGRPRHDPAVDPGQGLHQQA